MSDAWARWEGAGLEAIANVRQSGVAATTKRSAVMVALSLLEVPITTYANATDARKTGLPSARSWAAFQFGREGRTPRVFWIDPNASPDVRPRDGDCVLYLGKRMA